MNKIRVKLDDYYFKTSTVMKDSEATILASQINNITGA